MRSASVTGSLLCFGAVALWAASGAGPKIQYIDNPAASGSSVPKIVAGRAGSVILSWVEPSALGKAFRFSRWDAGHWSAPQTVADNPDVLAASSSEPGILELPDGVLIAQWLTRAPEKEANHIVIAASKDSGKTWSRPVVPYRNSTPGEHMYVALFPWPAGGAGVAWLDPRGGEKTPLVQTTIDTNGVLGPERTIDSDVCSCCPTSGVMTAAGPLLMFRGRTKDDVRDMQVTTLLHASWQSRTLFTRTDGS